MSFCAYSSTYPIICFLLILPLVGNAQERQNRTLSRPFYNQKATPAEAELARLRAEVIERMKESRAGAEKLLALHEEEKKKLTELYRQRLEIYKQGLISRIELEQVQQAVATATQRADADMKLIAEYDIAITEATMRDELLRLPALAAGGYSESGKLIRFNGGAAWSLVDAPKVEKFFSQTFGRGLPISAYGQSPTHDRLRFDHREAMDVALHPDSDEGRSLMAFLRRAGIPFIAFKSAVPGAATGAHIHIGPPSLRSMAAR